MTGAQICAERGRSIALGKWHVTAGEDSQPVAYFVPDETGKPRKALIGVEMLRDTTRFDRVI
jgi:hypothetical protein